MGLRRIGLIKGHPQAELRCIEDYNDVIARKVGEEVGCEYCSGWEGVVSRPDVDCVVVSVPNKFHRDIVIAALEAGKHVFCEKPLARNPIEAQEIVKAAERSRRFLKVGSNLRYFPSVLKAKELLDSGEIGEVLFARGWIGHSGWQIGSWYSDAEIIGGGTLLDNGCHLLDLYRWFLGEVESCIGFVSTSLWPISPLEDNAMATFRFTNGKMAFLQSSWTEWVGYMYLEIYGTQGFLRIDNRGQSCITTLGKRDGQNTMFDYSEDPPMSYVLEFNDYVDAIASDRQPLPSGLDGLRAVQMAHAVYRSAQLGKEVKVLDSEAENLPRREKGDENRGGEMGVTQSVSAFGKYGEYYDLLYLDKDYERECDFLESILKKYSSIPIKSIFDGGCGTGGHAIPLARRGYEIIGVDASEVMIGKAREKAKKARLEIDFHVADLCTLSLDRKFDAAICMFAVMDYFVANDELGKVMRNIRRVLKEGALFIFDVWNGLAVLRILPEVRVKVMEGGGKRVIRWVHPELDSFNHLCRDRYHLIVTEGEKLVDEVTETHTVRYFFPQEISHYLRESGFEVVELCPFLSLGGKVDENVWNMTCVARAKGE